MLCATVPGQRTHGRTRATLPGGELAIVVLPARRQHDGEGALWGAGCDEPKVRC